MRPIENLLSKKGASKWSEPCTEALNQLVVLIFKDSKSSTTSSGYQYPDNEYKSSRIEAIADYAISENQNVQLNIRYEDYSEDDYLFNNEVSNMGDVLQDYSGVYGGVYWKFRFWRCKSTS